MPGFQFSKAVSLLKIIIGLFKNFSRGVRGNLDRILKMCIIRSRNIVNYIWKEVIFVNVFKKHRSHISGKGRWLKSKLAHRLVERGVKKLTKKNNRHHKEQLDQERRNREETAMNGK